MISSEEKICKSLDDLHQRFSNLAKVFKMSFREKIKRNSQLATDVSEWLIEYMEWEHGSVDNNLDDIFRKMRPYYDFIDCKLLLDMSKRFLQDVTFTDCGVTYKLVDELHSHTLMSKSLCTSNTVSDLKKLLQEHYKPFDRNIDNLPCINIHLQTCWDCISIRGLYKLIEKLLPQKYKQSIIECIEITNKCVIIKLHILDFTADSLIEYTGGKLQFMHLIGIFSLYINDHPVLQEDENMNFTFELALLKAVTAGNNEAVEFLLQLETVNIDHTNEEGKTALMLACERGHEDIVHSLLSAGANVNIQNNNGWTALMIAIEHNHISIIHMLHVTVDEGWLFFEIIIFIFSIKACIKIKEILRSHYATLEEASKGNLSSISSHLYAKGIISKSVRDSQSYSNMINNFKAKLSLLNDVSELKRHCQVFLECISQGGPTDAAARSLAIEWGQVFDMESLLLPVPASSTMISPPHTPSPSPTSNRLIAMIIFIIFVVVPVILAIIFHSGNIHASNLKLPYLTQLTHLLKNNYTSQVMHCLDRNNYEMLQEVLVHSNVLNTLSML